MLGGAIGVVDLRDTVEAVVSSDEFDGLHASAFERKKHGEFFGRIAASEGSTGIVHVVLLEQNIDDVASTMLASGKPWVFAEQNDEGFKGHLCCASVAAPAVVHEIKAV